MRITISLIIASAILLSFCITSAWAECEPFYGFEIAYSKKLGKYIKDSRNNRVLSSGYWSMDYDEKYGNRVYAKSSYRTNEKTTSFGGKHNEAFSSKTEYDEVTVSWNLEVCIEDNGVVKVYYTSKSESIEHKTDYQ